jgi:hypothetical protein
MAVNVVAALQIPEGYTVRNVRGVLKVVVAKPRKAAIVQEEKAVLKAVRKTDCYGFCWQESMIQTVIANKGISFTASEMYEALVSVSQGEDMDSFRRVEMTLDKMTYAPSPVRLEKIEQSYKIK